MSVFIIHVLFKLFNIHILGLLSSLPLITLFTFSCILFLLALFCSFSFCYITYSLFSFICSHPVFVFNNSLLFCWMPRMHARTDTHPVFFSFTLDLYFLSLIFLLLLFHPIYLSYFCFHSFYHLFFFLFYFHFSFVFLTPPFSLPPSSSLLSFSYLSIYHF